MNEEIIEYNITVGQVRKEIDKTSQSTKIQSFRTGLWYKFGIPIPTNHDDAVELDQKNRNKIGKMQRRLSWSRLAVMKPLWTFWEKGRTPADYKRIQVHMVYDEKHDGSHKA